MEQVDHPRGLAPWLRVLQAHRRGAEFYRLLPGMNPLKIHAGWHRPNDLLLQ